MSRALTAGTRQHPEAEEPPDKQRRAFTAAKPRVSEGLGNERRAGPSATPSMHPMDSWTEGKPLVAQSSPERRALRVSCTGSDTEHLNTSPRKPGRDIQRPGKLLRRLEYPHHCATFNQLAWPLDQNMFQTLPRETILGAPFIYNLCKASVSIIRAAAASVSMRPPHVLPSSSQLFPTVQVPVPVP